MSSEAKLKNYHQIQIDFEKYPFNELSNRVLSLNYLAKKLSVILNLSRCSIWLIQHSPDLIKEVAVSVLKPEKFFLVQLHI